MTDSLETSTRLGHHHLSHQVKVGCRHLRRSRRQRTRGAECKHWEWDARGMTLPHTKADYLSADVIACRKTGCALLQPSRKYRGGCKLRKRKARKTVLYIFWSPFPSSWDWLLPVTLRPAQSLATARGTTATTLCQTGLIPSKLFLSLRSLTTLTSSLLWCKNVFSLHSSLCAICRVSSVPYDPRVRTPHDCLALHRFVFLA